MFKRQKPSELDGKEGCLILGLLRYVLKYGPAERPSVVDILNHPWYKEVLSLRHAGSVVQLVLFLLFCNPAIHYRGIPDHCYIGTT